MIVIEFTIPDDHGPAFRSAVDEFSAYLADRAEGQRPFPTEAANTDALVSVGKLRAVTYATMHAAFERMQRAVRRAIPEGHPRWYR